MAIIMVVETIASNFNVKSNAPMDAIDDRSMMARIKKAQMNMRIPPGPGRRSNL